MKLLEDALFVAFVSAILSAIYWYQYISPEVIVL